MWLRPNTFTSYHRSLIEGTSPGWMHLMGSRPTLRSHQQAPMGGAPRGHQSQRVHQGPVRGGVGVVTRWGILNLNIFPRSPLGAEGELGSFGGRLLPACLSMTESCIYFPSMNDGAWHTHVATRGLPYLSVSFCRVSKSQSEASQPHREQAAFMKGVLSLKESF